MNKRVFVLGLATSAVALVLTMTAGTVLAAGWNHDYTDASNDTTYANVDITRVKSYAQGTDVILELTVRGVIEDSSNVAYAVYTAGQSSGYGMFYANTMGAIVYQGGSSLNVTKISSNTLQGTMPKSGAGSESSFDVIGFSGYTSGSTVYSDYAGAAHGGDGTTDAGLILGMAFGLFLLVLLVPIIILIVIIIVILLVLKQKKAPVPPPMQQAPYPQQQYPQYPPQQYPQPPQQYPPQGPPPQPPGQ